MKLAFHQESAMKKQTPLGRMLSPVRRGVATDLRRNTFKYIIVLPVLIWMVLFCYKPIYGVIIAFQNYRPRLGIDGSEWIGLQNFIRFFKDPYFMRTLRNTFIISFLTILFSFPVPIILALLLNEIRAVWFKKVVQTVTYLPHFIAMVIACALVTQFCRSNGIINDIIALFGGERANLLGQTSTFYPVYIISGIWKEAGWSSIIYLAALSSIDQEQYEAARLDGAGRLQQLWHITLPGLLPTISMLLVLKMGQVMSVGYEKILLLYQPITYEVADVISTYTFRKGLVEGNFGFGTAIDLFNSAVNIVMLLIANKTSKKLGQSGLF